MDPISASKTNIALAHEDQSSKKIQIMFRIFYIKEGLDLIASKTYPAIIAHITNSFLRSFREFHGGSGLFSLLGQKQNMTTFLTKNFAKVNDFLEEFLKIS